MAGPGPNIPGASKGKAKGASAPAPAEMPQGELPWEEEDEVFEEDFTETEAGSFPLAEEGFHPAMVVDFSKGNAKSSGVPQYIWEFGITAGKDNGKTIRYWTSLGPKARWKVVETLEAVGIESSGKMARFKKSDIVGRPCIIEVVHEEFENRMTNKISKVHPPDQDAIQAAQDSPAIE